MYVVDLKDIGPYGTIRKPAIDVFVIRYGNGWGVLPPRYLTVRAMVALRPINQRQLSITASTVKQRPSTTESIQSLQRDIESLRRDVEMIEAKVAMHREAFDYAVLNLESIRMLMSSSHPPVREFEDGTPYGLQSFLEGIDTASGKAPSE